MLCVAAVEEKGECKYVLQGTEEGGSEGGVCSVDGGVELDAMQSKGKHKGFSAQYKIILVSAPSDALEEKKKKKTVLPLRLQKTREAVWD